MDAMLQLKVELEAEEDGRWLAEVPELPGVLGYGGDADAARAAVTALALRVLAERIAAGEPPPTRIDLEIAGLPT